MLNNHIVVIFLYDEKLIVFTTWYKRYILDLKIAIDNYPNKNNTKVLVAFEKCMPRFPQNFSLIDLIFAPQPFFGESANRITGRICMGKEVLCTFEGHWDQQVYIKELTNRVQFKTF